MDVNAHDPPGARVCFYYRKTAVRLFPDDRPDVIAATIVLKASNAARERLKAKVFTHRGLFFSIEFPKRPDRYLKLHGKNAASLKVEEVEPESH